MNCNAIVYKEGSEKMHTGDRMKRIRLAFDMTQSKLGVRLGFDEKSAAIRVSQYESGYRVPKKDIIQEFCDIFKCQPMMVEGHGITLIDDFMINLLWLEDEKGIDIRTDDVKEYIAASGTPVATGNEEVKSVMLTTSLFCWIFSDSIVPLILKFTMKVKYFPIVIFSLLKSTSNLPFPEQQK